MNDVQQHRVRLGFRVKTSDGWHVHRVRGTSLAASPKPTDPVSKADAYRLMADWLDCGYTPRLFSVWVHVPRKAG
jgi:hypothetical protein